jgi:hypothetical protein
MNCYCVEVTTTNAIKNVTVGPGEGRIGMKDAYFDCVNGILYVITDEPEKIFSQFPWVKSITKLGVGYVL